MILVIHSVKMLSDDELESFELTEYDLLKIYNPYKKNKIKSRDYHIFGNNLK